MNPRKAIYFALVRLRGQALGRYYNSFLREYRDGIPPDTTTRLLVDLLTHCKHAVPYYAEVMYNMADSFNEDPKEYLRRFPILTKDIIRNHFDELKSTDLARRNWYFNTSGGSTGEPVKLIQDWEFVVRSGAITLLYSKLAGREIGEREVFLWGSTRDIAGGSEGWKAQLVNRLTNTTFLNAFLMTPGRMREYIAILNVKRPRLIVAYADSLYELARFAEREGLQVLPQAAAITSAGTLYPFMREKIEEVFRCKVFDRYGSREVGDIACEHSECGGLWVGPWGNYVEIVDSEGNRVPEGTEGEILVTSLTNFAMPLVRYRIGDRGTLSSGTGSDRRYGQVLKGVLGRTDDMVRAKNGVLIHGGYFMVMLFFRDWIRKYQVIQKSYSSIVFRIIRSESDYEQAELDEIVAKTKLAMGDDCDVIFEFVKEIPTSASGKYRYIISEVSAG